jgi:hypothetical protein
MGYLEDHAVIIAASQGTRVLLSNVNGLKAPIHPFFPQVANLRCSRCMKEVGGLYKRILQLPPFQ